LKKAGKFFEKSQPAGRLFSRFCRLSQPWSLSTPDTVG
jgi:hypothetical protein